MTLSSNMVDSASEPSSASASSPASGGRSHTCSMRGGLLPSTPCVLQHTWQRRVGGAVEGETEVGRHSERPSQSAHSDGAGAIVLARLCLAGVVVRHPRPSVRSLAAARARASMTRRARTRGKTQYLQSSFGLCTDLGSASKTPAAEAQDGALPRVRWRAPASTPEKCSKRV